MRRAYLSWKITTWKDISKKSQSLLVTCWRKEGVHVNILHVVYPGNQRIYSWANIDNLSKHIVRSYHLLPSIWRPSCLNLTLSLSKRSYQGGQKPLRRGRSHVGTAQCRRPYKGADQRHGTCGAKTQPNSHTAPSNTCKWHLSPQNKRIPTCCLYWKQHLWDIHLC